MTGADRAERTRLADLLCVGALDSALDAAPHGRDPVGISLVAVGGYGRGELAPYSDLDVVLVHDDGVEAGEVAGRVWYPLWDAGVRLDHAVRRFTEMTSAARDDPRVALGLLDLRHLAGDPHLTLRLRTTVLADWRRDARRRLPAVRALVEQRTARAGELAHASVPDLKESLGGLRDATVMKALVATWLVDVPHADLERCRGRLLDVRDALHEVNGRPGDRIAPDAWPELAGRLRLGGPVEAQRHVRELGRRVTHLARLTWRRADAVLDRPSGAQRRAPALRPVARGVALSSGEVVLAARTDPAGDPLLLLRAAAEAAERGLALAPATAARLAREGTAIPEPWDEEARRLLVRLLAAGPGLRAVWETLEETGALARLLPEWERVHLLPHASEVHRFTVDRHLVETCIEASVLLPRVARPDLLVLAALLHDIGKGGAQDHSVAGEPVAVAVARRLGLEEDDAALLGRLVRRHLLLAETATRRDLDDPATVAAVAAQVQDTTTLDLLEVLTEADARATSPKAWTPWRAGLVHDLAQRVRARLTQPQAPSRRPARVRVPDRLRRDPRLVDVRVERSTHGSRVTVLSGDRIGLAADVAGALAVQRLTVRSARVWTQDDVAVSVWEVAEDGLDEAIVRERFDAVLSGRLAVPEAPRADRRAASEPVVLVRHEASSEATVVEVRAPDRPGLVHAVCRALAGAAVSVRSAHVTTVGPQAVDVFYVGEPGAGALADDRAAEAAHAIRAALSSAATLGT